MTSSNADFDMHDITDQVTPVIAQSPLLDGGAWPGFTNGKSFYFTDSQLGEMSTLLSSGQLRRRAGGGWEEVIPGKGLRYLAERHIGGVLYYRLRQHWEFVVTAS